MSRLVLSSQYNRLSLSDVTFCTEHDQLIYLDFRIPPRYWCNLWFFWVITRRRVVIIYTDVSRQRVGPIFMGQDSEMERRWDRHVARNVGINNYYTTPCNYPKRPQITVHLPAYPLHLFVAFMPTSCSVRMKLIHFTSLRCLYKTVSCDVIHSVYLLRNNTTLFNIKLFPWYLLNIFSVCFPYSEWETKFIISVVL
jgi:hypothetical protein